MDIEKLLDSAVDLRTELHELRTHTKAFNQILQLRNLIKSVTNTFDPTWRMYYYKLHTLDEAEGEYDKRPGYEIYRLGTEIEASLRVIIDQNLVKLDNSTTGAKLFKGI